MELEKLNSLRFKLKSTLAEDGGISLVIKTLKEAIPSKNNVFDALIQLESRQNETNLKSLKRLLTDEELQVAYNQIRQGLLDLLDLLKPEDFSEGQQEVSTEAEMRRGNILYRVPDTMLLEQETRCQVRIALDEAVLVEKLDMDKHVRAEDIRVSDIMQVELLDPGGDKAFEVRGLNSAEQFIEAGAFTEWTFFVKPTREGRFPLVIKVAVIELIQGKERKREIVLEEQIQILARGVPIEDKMGAPMKTAQMNFLVAVGAGGAGAGLRPGGASGAAAGLAGAAPAGTGTGAGAGAGGLGSFLGTKGIVAVLTIAAAVILTVLFKKEIFCEWLHIEWFCPEDEEPGAGRSGGRGGAGKNDNQVAVLDTVSDDLKEDLSSQPADTMPFNEEKISESLPSTTGNEQGQASKKEPSKKTPRQPGQSNGNKPIPGSKTPDSKPEPRLVNENPLEKGQDIQDPDGNKYPMVRFQNKNWLAENLRVNVGEGSWCYGDRNANCKRYGRLYTWEAARKGCTSLGKGWRLPTEKEWREMIIQYGSIDNDPEAIRNNRPSAYSKLVKGGISGFNITLSGLRLNEEDQNLSKIGAYWTATKAPNNKKDQYIYFYFVGRQQLVQSNYNPKDFAQTCRCIQD